MRENLEISRTQSIRRLLQKLFIVGMLTVPILSYSQHFSHRKTTNTIPAKKVREQTDANRLSVMKIRKNMKKSKLHKKNSQQHSGAVSFFSGNRMRQDNRETSRHQRKAAGR